MDNTDENPSDLAKDLVVEYTEIGADKLIEESKQYLPFLNDLGEEIPYVKTLIAAIKAPRTLSDFLLGRKVFSFLYTSNLNEVKLEKFKRKFSKTKQERLWEQVVFSINTHDDKIKSEIIGKLFAALVDDSLNEDDFFALVHATNSLNLQNLEGLKSIYMLEFVTSPSTSQMYSFAMLGLIDIDNSSVGTWDSRGVQYPLNQLGWKYIGIVNDFPESGLAGYKIGEDVLVPELNEDSQPTGKSYPLGYIKSNGLAYRKVDLFVVQNNTMLCGSDDLPFAAKQYITPAGETPQKAAQILSKEFETSAVALTVRRMEDIPVQNWAFAAKGSIQPENTYYRSISEIRTTIREAQPKNDNHRYFVKILEELDRHLRGDLKEQSILP